MHRRLGSATLSQQAFPGEGDPTFSWEKFQWDNIVVNKNNNKVVVVVVVVGVVE